ncbi:MAG TPA: hypothetical protein VNA20_12620 [Frankiaceae bacterium]|nr:hypothetical protein [Frankiaceae bacterium]
MAGKAKFAERMAKYLNEPVDAACPITRPGGTNAQIGGAVGGIAGAAIQSRSVKSTGDVEIPQFAWLGLGKDSFAIAKANFMGKPTGEPIARIAYADVTDATVTEGKITLRVDLDLRDGRHVAFEAKRHGQNKPSTEVIELLNKRCVPA